MHVTIPTTATTRVAKACLGTFLLISATMTTLAALEPLSLLLVLLTPSLDDKPPSSWLGWNFL